MEDFGSMRMPCSTLDVVSTRSTYFSEAAAKIAGDLENMASAVRGLSLLHSQMLSGASMAEIDTRCLQVGTSLSGIKPSEPHTPTRCKLSLSKKQRKLATGSLERPIQESRSPHSVGPKLHTPRVVLQPLDMVAEPDFPQPKPDQSVVPCASVVEDAEISPEKGTKTSSLHQVWADIDEQLLVQYLDSVKNARPEYYKQRSVMTNSKMSTLSLRVPRRTGWQGNSASSSMTASASMLTSTGSYAGAACQWIVGPLSTERLFWDLASILFIFDDVFMVPLQVFEIPDWTAIHIARYISRIFWVADILMSFRTSFFDGLMLETLPSAVARHYIRTSFPLDISLVCIQWLKLLGSTHVAFDTIQVFRLLRLRRLSQLKKAVLERSNSNHIHLYLDSVKVAVFCLVAIHLTACGWYWIGDYVKGWTRDDHMQGVDLWYSYFAAARWTVAQVSGRTDLEARTTTEYMYTCCACVFGLIIMSLLISTITNTMIELTALDRERLTQLHALNAYLKKNRVSMFTARHAKTGLEAEQKAMINLERDRDVLRVLPREVRADLLYEIHEPLLTQHQLFLDFTMEFPRMLRSLCAEVVKQVLAHENEVMFATGDHCTRIHFLATGLLTYQWQKRAARTQTRGSDIRATSPDGTGLLGQKVMPKRWVSEAALWVEWENQGELAAVSASSLVTLEVHEFISVVKKFRDGRARSVIYARVFVSNLGKLKNGPSDILEPIRFYLPIEGQEVVMQSAELDSTSPKISATTVRQVV